GREDLIEKMVGLAENLVPIALVGAGGIGKTAIALTVLHHGRIKERFGGHRRFIRCDQFPASRANFLRQLSQIIGAGVENPEDLASLRSFLSCREMLIVLDNAESILDPQGTDARDIHKMVKELSQFSNICLCVTSRISNVPPNCKRLEIPTLSIKAACNIFYNIYGEGDRSGIIDDLLRRLDFHALSITLLATTASDNMWSFDRLAEEWGEQRTRDPYRSVPVNELFTGIELSLTSPTFRKLDTNARDLLGVVAFFPRGIDEKNLDWLFPTVPSRKLIFDKFCALSLTYRSNGFVTMLAPIRDYLSPQAPMSSPLLCTTKDHYLTRLSVDLDPD
ncbi:P-loop containing nucleoside triphosphate hydrolase protein, partial [Thelephora terrestris]